MASIVKRTARKDGTPSYHVKYRAGDGRVLWERYGSAKEAKARKAEVELELARTQGRWTPPVKVTLNEYAEQWLGSRAPALRPSTVAEYRRILERDILPRFGHLPLAAITRSQLKAYAAERGAEGRSANTVRNHLAPLRALLASAVDDELLRANVAARIKRAGQPQRELRPPSREQVEALIAGARTPESAAIFTLAASLGLRRGELYALRWNAVDFAAGLVRVVTSNDRGVITATKTAAGERVVPMFGSARLVLLEQKARSRWSRPHDLVFPTAVGTPQNPATSAEREFRHALHRAGLPRLAFRFHDLRHYAVSQLIAQGASILQVARVAGHADPSVTLRVYGHLMADGLAEAARRYDPLRAVAVDEK
jgi:integrase